MVNAIDKTGIAAGGDIELLKCNLYSTAGVVLDISQLFTEIELYEDIYSHSLSGNITIIDTRNIVDALPIVGQEVLELVFKTKSFPDTYTINQKFYVYKLGDMLTPLPHKQVFTMYFTTPESMVDLNSPVSKAFTGTADQIITRLLGTDGIATTKSYYVEQSVNPIKFVSPYWSPFKCINYAASRAQTADLFKASDFLFFETNKGYRFVSANSMMGTDVDSIAAYTYSWNPARSGSDFTVRDVGAEMTKIYEINFDSRFNILQRMQDGAYGYSVWDHNLLLKTITLRSYDYNTNFESTNHLNKYSAISPGFLYGTNQVSSITSYPQVHDVMKEDQYGKVLTNKIPLMSSLDTIHFDIRVNGRTDIQCGDILDLTIAGMEEITSDEKYSITSRLNGRYLIGAIMHRITAQKHSMTIHVINESSAQKI